MVGQGLGSSANAGAVLTELGSGAAMQRAASVVGLQQSPSGASLVHTSSR